MIDNKLASPRNAPTRTARSIFQSRTSTPGAALQSMHHIAQMQRVIGNRHTLQMLRDAPVKTSRVAQNVIQSDRLVEIQGPGESDKNDFNLVRHQVTASLGIESAGNWLTSRFDVGPDEELFIWGHMDDTSIGTIEYDELAKIMVSTGFMGCRSVRLIGCNNPKDPTKAPKALWDALKARWDKKQITPTIMPVIHATRGPLQSNIDKDFSEGWWVGTSSKKEDRFVEDMNAIINYTKTGETNDFSSTWLHLEAKRLEEKYKKPLNTMSKEEVKKLIEKESIIRRSDWHESKKVDYPNLQTREQDEEGKEKVTWTPEAWASYGG